MWALVESGSVTKIYSRPQAFNLGDIQYPANTMELWSDSELLAIGIYPITVDNTNLKDKEYYSNTDITYAVDGSVVKGTYGTATALTLTDILFTAQVETDGLGTEGEVKSAGLKNRHKEKVNGIASSLLPVSYTHLTLPTKRIV